MNLNFVLKSIIFPFVRFRSRIRFRIRFLILLFCSLELALAAQTLTLLPRESRARSSHPTRTPTVFVP